MKNLKQKANYKFKKGKAKSKAFLKKVWQILQRPEMAILPGQLAFFLILSLVPIITLIGFVASYFNISINYLVEIIKISFNEDVANVLIPFVSGESIDFNLTLMYIIMFYSISDFIRE